MDDSAGLLEAGRHFGEYELLEELGRGGMGVVCRAWQPRLTRSVALKMLVSGVFAQPVSLERFRREAMAAARLRHPGIAVVHDAGEQEGQIYYSMELLEGGSMADWLIREKPGIREIVTVVAKAARAVGFAHAHGVLHRDIKPSNILLTEDAQPKIADFGLALLAGEMDLAESGGHVMGTPAYMSPEAAAGEQTGTAADVYALGAVLYQSLTGRAPHPATTPQAALRQAREGVVTDVRRLHSTVPQDLAMICMKCIARDPTLRYASGEALAGDLERFLEGKSVLARPLSPAGQVLRWAKRNRALAGLAIAFVLSLIAGTVLVLRQAAVNVRQTADLHREQDATRRIGSEMVAQLYAADVRAASQEIAGGNPEGARRWLLPHQVESTRGLEWHWLMRQSAGHPATEIFQSPNYVSSVDFSNDGRSLVVGTVDGGISNIEVSSGGELRSDLGNGACPQFSAATGRWYVADGRVKSDSAKSDVVIGPTARQLAISDDGEMAGICSVSPLFFLREAGVASVMEMRSQRVIWEVPSVDVRCIAINHDGSRLATAMKGGGVILWDTRQKIEVRRWDLPQVCSLRFSPDGSQLAAGGLSAAWLMSLDRGTVQMLEHVKGHHVTDVTFSPDGKSLATSCTDRGVRVWLNGQGGEPIILRGHGSEVWSVAWQPGGHLLASGEKGGRVLLWDTANLGEESGQVVPSVSFVKPVFLPDSSGVLVADRKFPLSNTSGWVCATGAKGREFGRSVPIGTTRDSVIFWNSGSNQVEWWTKDAAVPTRTLALPPVRINFSSQIAASPDGATIARLDDGGLLTLYPVAGNASPRAVQVFESAGPRSWRIRAMTWSPDGRFIAAGGEDGPFDVRLVDLTALKVSRLAGPRDEISGIAFSPDSRLLAAAGSGGEILVWKAGLSEPPIRLTGHDRNTSDLVFAPDGRSLISLGTLEGVKFWHVETWRELARMPIPDAAAHLAVSPDGAWLAVSCGDDGQPVRTRILPLK